MTSKFDVILVGFTVTDEMIEQVAAESAFLPTQTHRFAWNLIATLQAGGASVRALSALPVPNFPRYPYRRIRTQRFERSGVPGVSMGFVNVLGAKHVTRAVQVRRWAAKLVRDRPADVVVVHGVHSPFLWQALAMKKQRRTVACAVLTDLPGVALPEDGRMTRRLKAADRRIVSHLLARFDAVIALTPDLAQELAPGVPAWVTPGFAPTPRTVTTTSEGPCGPVGRRVAYAGGLVRGYGVDNLVKAFRCIEGHDLVLEIYGRGELEDWVRDESAKDPRIRYEGTLTPDRLYPRLSTCSVLVNPRTLSDRNLRYSFPSKILEYASLGVPTVTTRLPGITDELAEHLVVADGDSPTELREAICRALALEPAIAAEFGARAIEHVRLVWSPRAQGPALSGFLSEVCRAARDRTVVR